MPAREEVKSFKEIEDILRPLQVSDQVKAQAFADYFDSKDERDFTTRFKSLEGFPDEMKAQLYAHKYGQQKHPSSMLTPEGMGEVATAELPAIGATIGAMGGPLGIPVGAAAGTAARQLIRSHKGEQVPTTVGGSLAEMGVEAGKQSAYELGGRAVGAGFRLLKKAARPLYKSTLSFPALESLPARHEATEQGIHIGASVREAPKGLPRVQKLVGDMTALVDTEVAKAKAAGTLADTKPIYDAVRQQIQDYAKSLTPDEAVAAAEEVERQLAVRLGGSVANIAAPGGGVVKMAVPGPRHMDPELLQEAKRAQSRMLRKAYGEEKGPAIETRKAVERGAKEAMEQAVPSVKEPNWNEHVALTLQDAMERTLKNKPAWTHGLLPYLIGGAAAGMVTGHMTPSMITSLAAHEAVRNPAVMSRLAIWLDRMGTKLPKIAEPAVKYGLRFGLPLTEDIPPSKLEKQQTP